MKDVTEIEELLMDLIKIPSVFGHEKDVAEFVIQKLEGFEIEKQFVAENRFNIIATKGNSKKWLVAHMDTVPGEVPLQLTEDAIFGRGACDNKQSVAGSIIIGNKLKDINLLFTVGEEGYFEGAIAAQKSGIGGDLVVVQEPTNFELITGQRGIIDFTIQTKGISKHSSFDNLDSAIHKILDILAFLREKKWTAFNVGIIEGGTAGNISAGNAEVIISVRPKSIEEYNDIIAALKNIEAKVDIENCYEPHISNLKIPLNIGSRGFTEMYFFDNSIVFGAGDISFAHADNEHILRKDLNQLPEKLMEVLNLKI